MNELKKIDTSNYTNSNQAAPELGYIIGCQALVQSLAKHVPKTICDLRAEADHANLFFVRDHAVKRLDGSLLIPYSFQFSETETQLKALQSCTPNGQALVNSMNKGFGTGFEPDNREHALRLSQQVSQSTAAIEGGNCYLFKDSQGRPTALVGKNSLLLTLLAMEEQQLFKTLEVNSSATPSEQAFQMARNWAIYQESLPINLRLNEIRKELPLLTKDYSSNTKRIGELQLEQQKLQAELRTKQLTPTHCRLRFQSPCTELEKTTLRKEAQAYDAKILLAKTAISEELGIPKERIAYMEQSRFHIDMELFSGPDDTVFLHSEALSQEIIEEDRFLKEYYKESLDRLSANQATINANRAELTKLGLKTVLVPGVYEAPGKPTINFMNGLLVRPDLFLTNDPINCDWAKGPFQELTKRSKFSVEFVGDGILQEILTQNRAGLRCLTLEQVFKTTSV